MKVFNVLLAIVLLAPSIALADPQSDQKQTLLLRYAIISSMLHSQNQGDKIDEFDKKFKNIISFFLPKIADSAVVCDGKVYVGNDPTTPDSSDILEVYQKEPFQKFIHGDDLTSQNVYSLRKNLPVSASLHIKDHSQVFGEVDHLNGYEFEGEFEAMMSIGINRIVGQQNWKSYDWVTGVTIGSVKGLIVKNGRLLRPEDIDNGYIDSQKRDLQHTFEMIKIYKNHIPLTCDMVRQRMNVS